MPVWLVLLFRAAKSSTILIRQAFLGTYFELTRQPDRGISRAMDDAETDVARMGPSEPGNRND